MKSLLVFNLRRTLLRFILGHDTFADLMKALRTRGLRQAHTIDVVMRIEGREVRIQADWLKALARIFIP